LRRRRMALQEAAKERRPTPRRALKLALKKVSLGFQRRFREAPPQLPNATHPEPH
jgi:hypothetical protein